MCKPTACCHEGTAAVRLTSLPNLGGPQTNRDTLLTLHPALSVPSGLRQIVGCVLPSLAESGAASWDRCFHEHALLVLPSCTAGRATHVCAFLI